MYLGKATRASGNAMQRDHCVALQHFSRAEARCSKVNSFRSQGDGFFGESAQKVRIAKLTGRQADPTEQHGQEKWKAVKEKAAARNRRLKQSRSAQEMLATLKEFSS